MAYIELGLLYPNCTSNIQGDCLHDFTQYICVHKHGGENTFEFIGFILQNQKTSSAFSKFFLFKVDKWFIKGNGTKELQVTSVNQLRCLIFTDTDRFVIVWTHKFKKRKVKKHLLVELNRWTNKSSGKPILIGVDAVLCQEYKHRMGDHNLSWKKCCMSLERWG